MASAESALRIAMLDTTPDQEMLVLLLNLGANPYIPDKKGLVCRLFDARIELDL